MAFEFDGVKLPQTELELIQKEIYADWETFREQDIHISQGHKSGVEVYESKVSVGMQAYDSGAVEAGSDELTLQRTPVSLTKIMYKDQVDYNVFLNTRFENSMARGAFNTVSNEANNQLLQQISPAIAQDMESKTWSGATAATKTAIAGLTAGAGQGYISVSAQTAVAGMDTNLFDSLIVKVLYNDSISKVVSGAGLGDYKKVVGFAGSIDETNIANEYALLYKTLDPKVIKNATPTIFAPLSHRQYMMVANNSVGASSNQNFVFSGTGLDAKAYYNGIEVKFKPLDENFMIATPPNYLKLLFDLVGDMSELKIGDVANGADKKWYKNVQAIGTWCTNQKYITVYGG